MFAGVLASTPHYAHIKFFMIQHQDNAMFNTALFNIIG